MKTPNEKIAELTKAARTSLNMSQRQFAKYLNEKNVQISSTTIQDMEKSKIRKPNPEHWKVIAPLVGYTMENAIAYISGEEQTDNLKTQTIKNISILPSEDLQEIAKIITAKLAIQKLPEIAKIITERFEQELKFKRAA